MGTRKSSLRRGTGNMFVLAVSIIAVVFVPVAILLCVYGPVFISGNRAESVAEAAVLVAAKDLSRIVIPDNHFGFISLSNYPATGTATVAPDGHSAPVTALDTLDATLTQIEAVAQARHNVTMTALVDDDRADLKASTDNLAKSLQDAVQQDIGGKRYCDINGKRVCIQDDVRAFLVENLPAGVQLDAFDLALGWVEGEQAALAPNAHRISEQYFHEDDGRHFCNAVRLRATVTANGITATYVKYGQPFCLPDTTSIGAMILRFPGSPISGMCSWNELLDPGNFHDRNVSLFDVVQGDFPFDPKARVVPKRGCSAATAELFARHLYCWLRSMHARAKTEAVLSMLDQPLDLYRSNVVYVYELADGGAINRSMFDSNQFARPVVSEGQFMAMADATTDVGSSVVVLFRNDVDTLGCNERKHGGYALSGYPLRPTIFGSLDYDVIRERFPERSKYNESVAIDIEIGGTNRPNARNDIVMMHQRTRNRKI